MGKRLVLTNRNGGAFGTFTHVIDLLPREGGTELRTSFESTASRTYFGEGFNTIMLDRLTMDNADMFLKTLKELAELRPHR